MGTTTDFDGNYSISVSGNNPVLVFSYLGYDKISQKIGASNVVNVVMKENATTLDEVVVTAMGITREQKSLTYATSTIKNEEVTRIKESNFVNSLQGKSAGLLITPNNTGAGGGSTKIVLRGQASILGTTRPLIVLDGIPMAEGVSGQATDLLSEAKRDGGDILSTLNPEDIESMTVLKGPNAAALYGSAANNGVLIITTKSGKQGKVKVNVTSTTSVETMFMHHKTQDVYGLTPNAGLEAWGPKISDMTQDQLASKPYYMSTSRDPITDFYNNGLTFINGITLSGGTENSSTYFSYNNTTQTGMVPNNKFSRNNFMLKETFNLFDGRVNVSASLNYINQKTTNSPVVGKVLSPFHAVYRMPSNVDMRYFRNHYQHTGTWADPMVNNPVTGNKKLEGQPIQTWDWFELHLNNPYWLTNMVNQADKRDRVLGNINLKVKLWRNIEYQTRANIDLNMTNGLDTKYATIMREAQHQGGEYWSGSGKTVDIFNDHLLTARERIQDKFDINVAVGTSFARNYSRSTSITTSIDTSGVPNAFVPQNSAHRRPGNPSGSATGANDTYDNNNWNAAIFATASVGLWDKVFVDGSWRGEWAKSFQQFYTNSSTYFMFNYYSAGLNMLLDKFIPVKMPAVNQMKLRANYAVVGNPIPNDIFGRQSIDFGTGVISPRPPLFNNAKPEYTTSYEAGLEMWMFDNKFNFDLTYYNAVLENQFMKVGSALGEAKAINNGRIMNQGVEFTASYRMNFNKDFEWRTGFNIAYNNNEILDTYINEAGVEEPVINGPAGFKVKYLKGGSYGDIYVNSFVRDKDGKIKINSAGNYADAVPAMASGKYETYVGNATAPVNFGWNNTFTWKDLTLYFLIDGKFGGKVMSLTEPDRDYYGLSERSAYDRLHGERVIQNGVEYVLKELPDGQKVSVENYYRTIGANPMEDYVYDATNIRLRDISVGYVFRNILGAGRNLSAAFAVKNVCFLYKNSPIDPDTSSSTANGFSGIDAYSLPTVRSFNLNLKLNF